ncbi:MAG: hypothetical protein A2Z25_21780 [Planctomycetes bacterium RBG_16_55_9]|nr:MAG: hypothetical protein A2Z25_21780 [Planctomycetes bacterium RBG_16_55_9]
MRDIYKNPILYYVLVPVIVGFWPLLVWAIYLPEAQTSVREHLSQYQEAIPIMMEILTLDPDRLELVDPNETAPEFTWGAVDQVANKCRIPEKNCELRSGMIITSGGQKNQSATVYLRQVSIIEFAEFLSMIQLRWVNLTCERVKLTKKENMPDNDLWDVDITFKYYY